MGQLDMAMAHTRRDKLLSIRRRILIGRAEFEKPHIGKSTICIASGREQQIPQNRRAHGIQFAGNRIGQQQRFRKFPEQFRMSSSHEGPGHCLVKTVCGQRTTNRAGAPLLRRDRHSGQCRITIQRDWCNPVKSVNAGDFLN